jgi:uncharacterized membrane protein YidH (DUF202 family)
MVITTGDLIDDETSPIAQAELRRREERLDLNPGFPSSAGRTPLAKVRTYLAMLRSQMASTRTALARGRTGLAFIRTGISFIAIGIAILKIFGGGSIVTLAALLLLAGATMIIDGLRWYLPARRAARVLSEFTPTEPTGGTTVLEVRNTEDQPLFSRTQPVPGAGQLRHDWSALSPVMRRRFLASDRTDLAEERTALAGYRTWMARARTGLAFTRTGVALAGLGIALLRQFTAGPWMLGGVLLLAIAIGMAAEGLLWYVPGRHAGTKGGSAVKNRTNTAGIWDLVFPPAHRSPLEDAIAVPETLRRVSTPGVWGTSGLALERTLLAERRNVMARLRTVMARSRTGLSFVRTGLSVAAVGSGLLIYFGVGSTPWMLFDTVLILAGLLFIIDGLYWHLPAEKIRNQFPYCFADLEIPLPDYGRPVASWPKAVFSHDDIA